ncbi:GNAT family N-acetyltransferase [Paenibacillus selenitireducens]|uniref:GNAT family N-acetyltransferase n=1 Tax=Paenibacillus selenitireducens TaxID=1324314 RepID=A0A1T2X1H0_9BACL|nr:GNAT family N-acetyltransferase [Paenibacillus selenitireducens]OPA73719.1 GNAT family N-acetyltransferase [Paenibacillus selenitireducens]
MDMIFNQFVISDDRARVDISTVKGFLARSYWASQRSAEIIERSIQGSVCYGVYDQGKQVGFARIVTDEATMYYLCDVFIDEAYRGLGIGKKLVEVITESERFRNLNGILGTADAHELYEQYHFVRDANRFMRRPADFLRNQS